MKNLIISFFRVQPINIRITALPIAASAFLLSITLFPPQANAYDKHKVKQHRHAVACYQYATTDFSSVEFRQEGLKYCNRAIRFGNLSAEEKAKSYVNRGILLKSLYRMKYAKADYRRARLILRHHPAIELNEGNIAFMHGRFERAIDQYNDALQLQIETPAMAYFNRGLANEKLGNYTAAIDDYQRALANNPAMEVASKQLEALTNKLLTIAMH